MGDCEGLQRGRRSRRGRARNFNGMANRGRSEFQAMDHRNDGEVQNLWRDCGARRRTQLARMRSGRTGIHVRAKMELRRQKDNSQQQGTNPQFVRVHEHVSTKTKLRPEWLRGQGRAWRNVQNSALTGSVDSLPGRGNHSACNVIPRGAARWKPRHEPAGRPAFTRPAERLCEARPARTN